jgi:hypothetical protein
MTISSLSIAGPAFSEANHLHHADGKPQKKTDHRQPRQSFEPPIQQQADHGGHSNGSGKLKPNAHQAVGAAQFVAGIALLSKTLLLAGLTLRSSRLGATGIVAAGLFPRGVMPCGVLGHAKLPALRGQGSLVTS